MASGTYFWSAHRAASDKVNDVADPRGPEERDRQAAQRDAAAAQRDAEWAGAPLTDHAAIDRLHAADDREQSSRDRTSAALDREVMGRAIQGRTVIGQAQGSLMAKLGVGPEAAFEMLVRQSQHSNAKLLSVAEDIVADHVRSLAESRQR